MTLNEIVKDIMLLGRGEKLSQSEQLQEAQVIYWINTYRALLFKQQFDKNYEIDRSYVQSLNCLQLEEVDPVECPNLIQTERRISRTVVLPKTIVTRRGNCFTFVGDIHGKPFQLTNEENIYYYTKRKQSGRDTYAFYKDGRIYIVHNPILERITVRGVFESPGSLADYPNNCTGMDQFNIDSEYPISANIIPILKDMIITKELKIAITTPSDNDNDGNNKVSPNQKQ